MRHRDGVDALPPLPAGAAQSDCVPVVAFSGLRLIPQPGEWHPSGGALAATGFAVGHPSFDRADALAKRLGLAPLIAAGGVAVTISTNPLLVAEGYALTIHENGIAVAAADPGEVFYAAVTLLTLRETHDAVLPHGRIADQPRFGWRGQHLDCARHFYQPATILRLMDLMALCKLNRFHWHFADE